jgi:hypothetical protein
MPLKVQWLIIKLVYAALRQAAKRYALWGEPALANI